FYNIFNGGDASAGHDINPYTGEPYEPQMVPRGDYARVLAEFWADGPDSETPPGHWFTILNYVNEQPQLEKRWKGEGPVLSDLEWDVKTYFVLGGAMHDCAISAWSVKGWYDYIRPVSAIRYMAEQGQSSSQNLPSYDPNGIPLIPGFIELVDEDDPLAGDNDEHVGKIKFRSWRGPDYIDNPFSDVAGVGWILAENWWPYQRPTFVTPPFAGFVSGHSTFSRGAAEVLTLMTGDPYFPGGMGEFEAPANEFLVFEDGPSVDLTLQWATYRDASDQSSLSRIWGGIHPPADDIPGRKIGIEAGVNAFNYAETFINNRTPQISNVEVSDAILNSDDNGNTFDLTITYDTPMDMQIDPQVSFPMDDPTVNSLMLTQNQWLNDTTYFLSYDFVDAEEYLPSIVLRIGGAFDQEGKVQQTFAQQGVFTVDSENPAILDAALSTSLIADAEAGNPFSIIVTFDESMDITVDPVIVLEAPTDLSGTLLTDELNSLWLDATTYQLSFFTFDANEEISDIGINIQSARDSLGNLQQGFELANVLTIDTKQPAVVEVAVNNELLNESNVGSEAVAFSLTFSEKMNQNILPDLIFPNENPLINSLDINTDASMWLSDTQYLLVYDLVDADEEFTQIDLLPAQAVDLAGNLMTPEFQIGIFSIDTRKPMVSEVIPSNAVFNDPLVGPATVYFNLTFDEQMNIEGTPELSFPDEDPSASIQFNESGSQWLTPFTFRAAFDLDDQNIELEDIDLAFAGLQDAAGNPFIAFTAHDVFDIDTRNPNILAFTANTYELMADNIGDDGFSMLIVTDEEMDVNTTPLISFPNEMPTILEFNEANSLWVNATTYQAYFNVAPMVEELLDIDVSLEQLFDSNGNPVEAADYPDYFDISIPVNTQDIPMVFQGLKIYPNPAKAGSLVRLEFAQAPQNLQWRLFDTQGKLVQENAAQISQQQYNLPTAELSNGVYFLQLISAEGSFTARLSIVR
ncbi:MAG: T9SS type A sorting domain-containing protein, partial [Saprospiraceae bacterium]|nr:T9SS type A sorting domain-containing protein [Saprospiraceae bacterium]